MKSTEVFKKVIEAQLQVMAAADPKFAEKLKNPKKSIDECITYILNTVKKSGCSGFSDSEIFGMAAHYYDEEKVDAGKPISCNVVVNHSAELSEEEIQKAKQEAKDRVIAQEQERLTKKVVKKVETPQTQRSLF